MKNFRKKIALAAVGAALATSVVAQTPGDLLRFSQYNYSLGTARSAAMGGAFTSLGADLSSMSINPAGLGMYRSSEFGISPSLTTSATENIFGGNTQSASKTKFTLGNIGAVFNLYQGTGALTSFSLGVGYNKLVDFNTTSMATSGPSGSSILDFFAANATGYKQSQLGSPENDPYASFRGLPVSMWGTSLAYQTYLINPVSNSPDETNYMSGLYSGDKVNPRLRNQNIGSVGEYSIAAGFNINNVFYFGLTMGVQDLYFRNNSVYSEGIVSSEPGQNLRGMDYTRRLTMSGTGVNFKFGMTVRPIENLRIGLAVHTPTFTSMDEEYVEFMSSYFNNSSDDRSLNSAYSVSEYNINSAARLLAGASYTLPGVGLISADYERVWYNGMRIKDTGDWSFEDDMKNSVKDLYKAANNFRAGIEVTPLANLYLRAGYAYYDKCLSDNAIFDNQANINSYQNYSVGLGYRFASNIYLDLTYIYTDYKYSPYSIYYKELSRTEAIDSGLVNTDQNRNTITLSLGFRF